MIANKLGIGLLITAFLLQALGSQAQEPLVPLKKVSKLKFDKKGALLFDFIEMFPDSSESAERVNQFSIEQNVTLSEIPLNTKRVQVWISLPGDERNQKLMNLEVNDPHHSLHRGIRFSTQINEDDSIWHCGYAGSTVSFRRRWQ